MNKKSPGQPEIFPARGGETGELIRAKDWSKTPVGPVETWPQSLRTTLGIILHSKFPMFLWWGPELTCFYNDAYRPSLGNDGKHPGIMGMPAKEAWPEIWDIISPLIQQVLNGGEATWSEDQLIPIYRNGKIEDVYWTFSYSPVHDETGMVAGVLVTCTETTEKVLTLKQLSESNKRFLEHIKQAPVAMCFFSGKNHQVEMANDLMLEIWGKTADQVMNKPIFEALPEAKGQGLEELLRHVFETGETFKAHERPVSLLRNGKPQEMYINFVYDPLTEPDGTISGIVAIAIDVTFQVQARIKLQDSEQDLRDMVLQAPIGVCVLDAATLVSEIVNDSFIEVAGKPYEAIAGKHYWDTFAEAKPYYEDALNSVVKHGKAFYANEVELMLIRNGKEENIFVTFVYAPLKNKEGRVIKIAVWVLENTPQVKARQKIQESEKRFRNTVVQAPLGITILMGHDFVPEMVNETYLQLVDRTEQEFIGRPLFESLPEVKEVVAPLLENVLKTGVPFHASDLSVMLNRYGKKELGYFNLVYHPFREDDQITGIMVVATEVTESVKAKQALTESEKQFRHLVSQSPIPMTIFRGPDHIIEMANKTMFEDIWRKKESEVVGRKALDVFPELKDQKYPALLRQVLDTGKTFTQYESEALVQGNDGMKKFYLDFEYSPLFDHHNNVTGIMITVNDVTEKVEARKKVEEAEERLSLATEATGVSTWDLDLQTREIIHSPRLAEIFGHDRTKKILHTDMRAQIHPDDIHTIVEKAFETAMQTSIYEYEARLIKPNNEIVWISTRGKVFFDDLKKPLKMVGTLRDITLEKYHRQVLQESEEKFRLLANSMPQHIWTSDPQGNLNYFNQSVYDYSGLSPEQIDKDGWLQIVHPDDRDENIRQWIEAITNGTDFLFEHRFRRHDGEYRWQLSRAIPQRDARGRIQMWVGTSTDVEEQKTFAARLEQLVNDRTQQLNEKNAELQTMNKELQSFAYISSHDLQEPLRKIQTFVSRILEKEYNALSGAGKDYFDRMRNSALRMQTLIEDLLVYSRTSAPDLKFEQVHLGSIVAEVEDDFKEELVAKKATIEAEGLCEARVIPFQFRQLLQNLVSNSLKFSLPGQAIHISIKSAVEEGTIPGLEKPVKGGRYCHFSFTDNGIGFEPEYNEKIFEVFQRLHNKEEYEGTGIGLAIVKKIVENHNGMITATGEPGKGARFDVYIPFG